MVREWVEIVLGVKNVSKGEMPHPETKISISLSACQGTPRVHESMTNK
jgi:hypothetical protein